MSVSDDTIPPIVEFSFFVVTGTTAGFFDFASRAMPISRAVALIAVFRNLFPAV